MTGAEGESLVERRRRIIRSEIGRVAIELFAEHGFDAVTVDQIAAGAGTSPRTFFRYFDSKDDVLLDYERRLQARLLTAFDEQPDSVGAVLALRQAYAATAHIEPADRPRVVQIGRILESAPALRARARGERTTVDTALVDHVAHRLGTGPESLAVRTIVAAMGAVATIEYQEWVHEGGHGDPADRIVAALDLLIAGLGALEHRSTRSRRKHG